MKKQTVFYWTWGGHAEVPDRLMTRDRMALLLRSWRRASRQPCNGGAPTALRRVARGCYWVRANLSGEYATTRWEVTPCPL